MLVDAEATSCVVDSWIVVATHMMVEMNENDTFRRQKYQLLEK